MEMNDVIYSFNHSHLLLKKKSFYPGEFFFLVVVSNLGDKVIVSFFSGISQNQDVITQVGTPVPILKKLRISFSSSYCQAFPTRTVCEWKQL